MTHELREPITSQRQPWWDEQERLVSKMAELFEDFTELDEIDATE
jgi:hypothetical protein